MKFVGLVGANYDQSYNRKLLEFIRRHFKIKFELEVLEIDEVPITNFIVYILLSYRLSQSKSSASLCSNSVACESLPVILT